MKKLIPLLASVFALLLVLPVTARADMGPKPSIVIDFRGLEGEAYYATLLSRANSTGPHSALERGGTARYHEGDEGYDAFLSFAGYKDTDGLYFLQYFQDCTQTQRFSWTYYPPSEFKILLYFPESDRFIVSHEIYERYAFDSYFTAEVTLPDSTGQSAGGIAAVRSYDFTAELLSLLARIVLTIAVELGVALLFGFRERAQLQFILLVNVMTQLALNVALNIINYVSGPLAFFFFYAVLEIFVLAAEGILYAHMLPERSAQSISGRKLWTYALTANALSFAVGWKLAQLIPGIF